MQYTLTLGAYSSYAFMSDTDECFRPLKMYTSCERKMERNGKKYVMINELMSRRIPFFVVYKFADKLFLMNLWIYTTYCRLCNCLVLIIEYSSTELRDPKTGSTSSDLSSYQECCCTPTASDSGCQIEV